MALLVKWLTHRIVDVLAFGGMVHGGVVGLRCGQGVGDAGAERLLEFFESHNCIFFIFDCRDDYVSNLRQKSLTCWRWCWMFLFAENDCYVGFNVQKYVLFSNCKITKFLWNGKIFFRQN